MFDFNQRVREWFNRALKEQDVFVKFILFYISLEVISTNDGVSVRSLLKQRPDLIRDINTKVLHELKNKLDIQPHLNMDPEGDHRWNGMLRDIGDWNSVVEFLARGRNNLFHGDKGLESERDIFIVTCGNEILEPIIRTLLPAGD